MQLRLQSISFTPGPRQLCWMQSLMIIFQRQRPLCCMISRRRRPRCRWRRRPPPWFCPALFPPHPAQNAPRVPAPVQLYHQLYNPRPLLTSWTILRQVWTLLYRQYRPDIALHYAKPLITNLYTFYLHIQRNRHLLGLLWAWHNVTTPLKWFPTFGFNKSWVQKYNLHVMTCCKLSSNSFSYVRHLLFHWCLLCRKSWTYQESELTRKLTSLTNLKFCFITLHKRYTFKYFFILNSSLSRWSESRWRWHW